MTLKFSEKFGNLFSHVFIFSNMFPESHGFVVMPVTRCFKDKGLILSYLSEVISEGIRNC